MVKTKNKLVTFLLAIALVFTMMPMQIASAADDLQSQAYAMFEKKDDGTYKMTFFRDEPNKYQDEQKVYDTPEAEYDDNWSKVYFTGFEEGNIPSWYNGGYEPQKVAEINVTDKIVPKSTTSNWFAYMKDVKTITNQQNLDTSKVEDMSRMFYGCYMLTVDLNKLNTQNVKNFEGTFDGVEFTDSRIPLDTSKAENMEGMFSHVNMKNLDVSYLNTSHVTNMDGMFSGSDIKKIDITTFNTSKVTDMGSMFSWCDYLEEVNASGIDTSNVEDLAYMFEGSYSLKKVNINGWDTSKCTRFGDIFRMLDDEPNTSIEEIDIRTWDSSKIDYAFEMFANMPNLKHIYTSEKFDIRAYRDFEEEDEQGMVNVFQNCPKLPNWDAKKTTQLQAHGDNGGYFTMPMKPLGNKLQDVSKIDRSIYTKESLEAFDKAVAKAKSVYNDLTTPIENYNIEISNLDKALKGLTVDTAKANAKKQLEEAIKKAKNTNTAGASQDSINNLKKVISDAEKVLSNPKSTKEDYENAIKKLNEAINAVENSKSKLPNKITGEITPQKPVSLKAVEKAIFSAKNDKDLKGSTFGLLKLNSKKQGKKNIKVNLTKVKGAKTYNIYGNLCGKGKKYKKIKTIKGKNFNVKKILGKKLKKGKYYKFIAVAVNGDKALALSKTIHVVTKGHKKLSNNTKVVVNKKVIKKAKKLKKSKTLALKAKALKKKGKIVKKHRKVCYESSNTKIAKVTKAGKIKAIKKGKCKVYAYAQNGVYKTVTVKVK